MAVATPGWVAPRLLAWHVDDLELYAVGVVEEDRIVARFVAVLLAPLSIVIPLLGHPSRSVVDDSPRLGGIRDVVDANRVAVIRHRMGI